ncbi:MAG: tetratricopeptide repeat protein, partial [Gammaproteobacteria bacterium]|nr:tetratricopeptide repeat protein [Gammaproteobacteria bacterium]
MNDPASSAWPARRRPLTALAVALVVALVAGAVFMRFDAPPEEPSSSPRAVTFNRDIAPIVFENCVVCHRPHGAAPFSLLDYAQASKRAGLIAALTQSRYMPPWLPARGDVELLGERGLSDEEIALIAEWVEQGALEGDAADLPPAPQFTDGWLLGEPDMVIAMPTPFTVPAEGVDVFRNFVLPIPVSRPRWVRAVELKPGNPRVVHHAVMQVDPSRASRRRDEEDAEVGFAGMDMAGSEPPGGQLIGWTPGKVPIIDDRLAWQVQPGSDVVLQLHMLPSGKPEPVAARIGLYFTDQPPEAQAFSLLMRNDDIDIPAGEADHVIEDSLTLPVGVEAIGIYPHAHYLGKRIEAHATLPDGTTRTLIDIPHWDFNWQDDYRFAEPLPLPAGTTIDMRFVFDNTASNPRNPNSPPERVRFGNRSSDEMATLSIQVLPARDEDKPLLREAVMRARLERNPDNWYAHNALAAALLAQDRLDEALSHNAEALRLHPRHPQLHYNLGNTLLAMQRTEEAVASFRRTLDIEPDHPKAHNNLAVALHRSGALERALEHYRDQLEVSPMDARAHANLGIVLLDLWRLEAAEAAFVRALELDPGSLAALEGRGDAARLAGDGARARQHYERALEIDADTPAAHYGLGMLDLAAGGEASADAHFRTAVQANEGYVGVLNDDAWRLATHPDPGVRAPHRALDLARVADRLTGHRVPELLDTLAAAQAANGRYREA